MLCRECEPDVPSSMIQTEDLADLMATSHLGWAMGSRTSARASRRTRTAAGRRTPQGKA